MAFPRLHGYLLLLLCLLLLPDSLHSSSGPPLQGPVFLSEPPSSVSFPATRGLRVPCTAFGRPAPRMGWIRVNDVTDSDVDTPLDDVPGLLQTLPNNTLHFLPFDEVRYNSHVHAGHFRCTATNSVGTIVSRTLSVRADLVTKLRAYNVHVNDVYVTSGNTAVMMCDVNPYFMRPHVTVKSWSRGAHKITSGGRFSVLNNGELHVRDVTSQDSYVMISCVTKNDMTSEVKKSDPATIYVSEPVNSAPNIETSLRHLVVSEGDDAELPCVARGFPLPVYTWSRDGVSVVTTQARVTSRGGNLLLRSATLSDSGRYECEAENGFGKATGSVELSVVAPLSAHVTPGRQTVDAGRDAAFNCSVYGSPVVAIRWLLNGRLLQADGSRIFFPTRTTLLVQGVMRSDRGMYQCAVQGRGGEEALGAAQLELGVSSPIFTAHFEDMYIRPGASASLKCAVAGNPTPYIRWTVDGDPFPRDARIRVGSDVTADGDVTSYVNITQVRVEDGGLFRCSATNQIGELSHVGRLNVYGLPYIRPLRNVTAVASHVMVVTCHVSGYPIKDVMWIKDGVVLPSNHRQHVSDDGTLSVDDVTRGHDDGPYTCRAVNHEGQDASREVYVTIIEPPVIDPFRFPDRKSGDRVSVSCAVSSGDLPMSIMWVKDGGRIPEDLGVITQSTGSYSSQLSIGYATPMHDGNYTCMATNRAASVTRGAMLIVNVPPRWVVAPHDEFVVLGREVTLHCQADGKPQPEIIWRKAKGSTPGDYKNVFPNNASDVSDVMPLSDVSTDLTTRRSDVMERQLYQMPNGSLRIEGARGDDGGYYLCHAGNGVGHVLSKVIQLVIHMPATFGAASRNVTVRAGDALEVDCEARGDRPLSIAWNFNGARLPWETDPRMDVAYYTTKTGQGSKLMFKSTSRSDTGFYVCNAQNVFGSDVTMVKVTIQEPPDAPTQLSLKQTGNGRVDVTWDAPYDGNDVITGYDVIYKNASESWSSEYVKRKRISGVGTTIPDLHPAFSYNFRVSAINSIGEGIPSDVISVTMGEEVPSGPARRVKIVAIGSRSLNVTWRAPLPEHQNGEVTGYFIGYKVHNRSAPYMYVTHRATPGSPLEVVLNDLEKFTSYAIHVTAYNEQGSGPSTADVITRTLEDVPSQPPQGVQAVSLTSHAVLVTWSPPPLSTLHGVLEGYRVLYTPVTHDQDETDAEVLVTSRLSGAIYRLPPYTNYSIQVLAFTARGKGVRSEPIYVTTRQDVPDVPADIKAVAAGRDTILVSWRPPLNANGIITKYTVYMQDTDSHLTAITTRLELPADRLSYRARALTLNHGYSFHVTAATLVGEGDTTRTVTAIPVTNASAQIASFSLTYQTTWRAAITLPCEAVGDPTPATSWTHGGVPVDGSERFQVLANGSLRIHHVTTRDAGNYTCRAENKHGADELVTRLVVQVLREVLTPPKAPVVNLVTTTGTTLQVTWRSSSNGGSALKGFTINIRRHHGDDQRTVTVGAHARMYTARGLHCGTLYHVSVVAFNQVGRGPDSNRVSVRTNGSAPVMPPQSMLVAHLNATYVDLDLTSWGTGGCELTSFDVRYRYWGDAQWETVNSYVSPQMDTYRVPLHPATWYILRVTAHNEAGATDSTIKLATPTFHGSAIKPIRIMHTNGLPFHERPHVMIPLVGCLIIVVVLIVALILFCKRRHDNLLYKEENASNLRRDLTAETSLILSDLEKRVNTDSESRDCHYTPSRDSQYTQSPGQQTKVTNLGDDDISITQRISSCSVNTLTDNEQNHYATLRCRRHLSADDLAVIQKDPIQLPQQPCYQHLPMTPHNTGIILGPHQYATVGAHRHTPCTAGVHGGGTHAHNDTPANRISTVSSATTDSSATRDELHQAYEARQLMPMEGLSRNTERSSSDDSGVREFTQSPPATSRGLNPGTTIPKYTGTPHLPAKYRTTPHPHHTASQSTYARPISQPVVYSMANYGVTNQTAPPKQHSFATPQHVAPHATYSTPHKGVLQRSASCIRSPKRENIQRRSSLRRSPPPPPPPRSSSEPCGARFSPRKAKASSEECRPLFPADGQVQSSSNAPRSGDEADILLEKFYRMLQDNNVDPGPGPSDDVMMLEDRPYSDYSVI